MKRTTSTLLFAMVIVALGATAVASAGAGNGQPRPYKGSDDGIAIGGECVPVSETVLECPFVTEGVGHGTHIGQSSTTSEGTTTLDFGLPLCELLDGSLGATIVNVGSGTTTAADGSTIDVDFDNTGCFDLFGTGGTGTFTGSQQITGGTGRFEGATGSTLTSGFNLPGGVFELDFVGTITF